MRIESLETISPPDHEDLRALLINAVEHGASVGYLWSEVRAEVDDYWRGVATDLAGGIPDYAANPDGRLEANAIFYKRL
jgi:hypothetical protein